MKKKIEVLDVDGHCDGCLLETDHCHKLWSGKLGLHYCIDAEDAKDEDCHEGIIRVLKHRVDFLEFKDSAFDHFVAGMGKYCSECESQRLVERREQIGTAVKVLAVLLALSIVALVAVAVR